MTTTPRTLTVTLPLPPAALSPNGSRGGYITVVNRAGRKVRIYKRSTAAADYRWECEQHLRLFGPTGAGEFYFARLSVTFRWCKGRRAWDADNALSALKPGVDALRDAGILRDDGAKRVSYGGVESVKCPRGCGCGGRVEIVVEEVPA